MRETYGFAPFYFAGESAALPLFEVNSWLTGRRGVMLPFTDECAPLSSSSASFDQLFSFAQDLGRERQWKSLEVRAFPPSGASQSFSPDSASLKFYGHQLELADGEAKVFGRFHSSVQRALRKAAKCGLRASIETGSEAMSAYVRLHALTRRKHGLPPQPSAFFQHIHRHLFEPGYGFISLVASAGQPVAAAIFFTLGPNALYKFGASDSRFDSSRPSNLAMGCAIQHLVASGFQSLDFGRTSIHNEGLRRYKLNWGTHERTIRYLKWDFRNSGFVRDRDQSSGWQTRFFRRFPQPISRLLGRLLYRHIA